MSFRDLSTCNIILDNSYSDLVYTNASTNIDLYVAKASNITTTNLGCFTANVGVMMVQLSVIPNINAVMECQKECRSNSGNYN